MSEPVHGTVDFFNPTCPISVGSDWDFQNCGPKQTASNYASELNAHGDELANALHGKKTTWSWTFVNNLSTGSISIPKGALVSAGWHVDQIQIVWGRDQMKPKMTVSAHRHEDGTNHAANSCRTYTATVEIDAVAFGVPADLGAISLASGAAVDFRSATYTLSLTHIDETAADGTQLAGENHDGVETLSVEFTCDATGDDYAIETGWANDQKTTTPSNTAATTTSLNLIHHIQNDADLSS